MLPTEGTRYCSMAGVHFDEIVLIKPPVDPWLSATAMGQADRKSLRPEPLQTRHPAYSGFRYAFYSAIQQGLGYVSSLIFGHLTV